MSHKYVYLFSEGNENMRELLGGKGANLAEMVRLGMPVPQGFTVSTEACTRYYEDGKRLAPILKSRFTRRLLTSKKSTVKNSATRRTRFSFPSVRARALPCPV